MSIPTRLIELPDHIDQTVEVAGWVTHVRGKGKLSFFVVRDGSAVVQCVAFQKNLGEEVFAVTRELAVECSVRVRGTVKADERSPGGVELHVEGIEIVGGSPEYPISNKEHGTGFLMEHRHLWLRSSRQHAVLAIRHEVQSAVADFLHQHGFVRTDSPILTPCAAEGTSNLFSTAYFDEGEAYLAQTGQLYVEAAMMAFGRVYCCGPTFRAEKSKTRRHLTEFWMVEPEAAFVDHAGNLELQEQLVEYVVRRVLERRAGELELLERDLAPLQAVRAPFPRITYDEAVEIVNELAADDDELDPMTWGEDFGAPHEVAVSARYDRPVFIERYPAAIKAFYMQPDPERPEVALCADLLAPSFGEVIGGSERIHDVELLEQRIREHGLDVADYQWYLDLRRYGTVPHSGFGLGIERLVVWITGIDHIRQAIPFPRMLYRIYP